MKHTKTYEEASRTEWQLMRMEEKLQAIGWSGDRRTLEQMNVRVLCNIMAENGVHLAIVDGQAPVTVVRDD